ncbi:MAG: hypothetical protein GXP19_06375 [Gammaproteobacteria bacterium]|nr:hypothetical protein [Gammaproteobacteria bacterium]
MKKAKLSNLFVAIIFTFVISGCLHDDDSVSVNIINGTWFGVEQDVNDNGASGIISFSILDGKITSVSRQDSGLMTMVDQNLVGTVAANTKSIFPYDLSDTTNTVGGLYVDTASSHYTFLDDKFRFGVMQKGAPDVDTLIDFYGNLVFINNDVAGSWSGFSVNVKNAPMIVVNNFNSQVTIDIDTLVFSGTDSATSVTGGSFDGNLSPSNLVNGIYTGTWMNPDDNTKTGDVTVILGPDKTFLSARFCLAFGAPNGNGVPNIELCTFASWNK